jgi:hypothetical protein
MPQKKLRNRISITVLSLFLLSACQPSSNAGSTVETYLKALSSGNTQKQKSLRCVEDPAFPDKVALSDVKKWEIISQKEEVDKNDPDSRYVEVSARIESMSVGGFPVNQTWIFTVWKSDELFEHDKRFSAKINQLALETRKTTNEIKSAMGEQIDTSTPSLSAPNRNDISSSPYCITYFKTLGG